MTSPRRSSLALYLVTFTAGMTTLAVEILTSRLIGNVFGTSNIVWAGVIGMTLFYLMLGYFLGGKFADRRPSLARFSTLTAWSALAAGGIPALSLPLLKVASAGLQRFDVTTSFAAALTIAALFAIPMTLLGFLPPFAVRLAMRRVSAAGETAGKIYALTTIGGLLGAFGPVLVTIPRLGTPGSFTLFAAALLAAAGLSVALEQGHIPWRSLWMPVLLLALLLLGRRGPLKPPPEGTRLLYERETSYNYVQVVETADGTRELLLNEGLATHSVYHPDRLETFGTWDYFLVGPYFNAPPFLPQEVRRVAILGLAAGTVARQYTAVYGAIPIDGVEIDPGIVEVGRRYFGMTMPNLNVIVEDARFALRGLETGSYDVVGIDAYRPPYIPPQLTTVEFFTEVRSRLADNGVVIINVGRTSEDRRLVEAMTATLLTVFPSVHTMDVPYSFNTILVATRRPTVSANLQANQVAVATIPDLEPLLPSSLDLALQTLVPTVASDLVFSDDRAPVEFISDSIVLEFILGPEAQGLRQQLAPTPEN